MIAPLKVKAKIYKGFLSHQVHLKVQQCCSTRLLQAKHVSLPYLLAIKLSCSFEGRDTIFSSQTLFRYLNFGQHWASMSYQMHEEIHPYLIKATSSIQMRYNHLYLSMTWLRLNNWKAWTNTSGRWKCHRLFVGFFSPLKNSRLLHHSATSCRVCYSKQVYSLHVASDLTELSER